MSQYSVEAKIELREAGDLLNKARIEWGERQEQIRKAVEEFVKESGSSYILGSKNVRYAVGPLIKDIGKNFDKAYEKIKKERKINPDATIEIESGTLSAKEAMSTLLLARGGFEFFALRDFARAAKYFEQPIGIFEFQEAYLLLGSAYLESGKKKKAIEALQKCIDIDPDSEEALNAKEELQEIREK